MRLRNGIPLRNRQWTAMGSESPGSPETHYRRRRWEALCRRAAQQRSACGHCPGPLRAAADVAGWHGAPPEYNGRPSGRSRTPPARPFVCIVCDPLGAAPFRPPSGRVLQLTGFPCPGGPRASARGTRERAEGTQMDLVGSAARLRKGGFSKLGARGGTNFSETGVGPPENAGFWHHTGCAPGPNRRKSTEGFHPPNPPKNAFSGFQTPPREALVPFSKYFFLFAGFAPVFSKSASVAQVRSGATQILKCHFGRLRPTGYLLCFSEFCCIWGVLEGGESTGSENFCIGQPANFGLFVGGQIAMRVVQLGGGGWHKRPLCLPSFAAHLRAAG